MPKPLTVSATASLGGKVQIREYRIDSSFFLSNSEEWDVSDLTDEQAEAFRLDRVQEIKAQLEVLAQAEFNALFDQMDK